MGAALDTAARRQCLDVFITNRPNTVFPVCLSSCDETEGKEKALQACGENVKLFKILGPVSNLSP